MRKTNSQANYNAHASRFRSPKGHESHAQITAFEDTWHWGEQAEAEFNELIHQPNTDGPSKACSTAQSPRYPDLTRGGLTFKKAKKEKTEEQLTFGKDEPAF